MYMADYITVVATPHAGALSPRALGTWALSARALSPPRARSAPSPRSPVPPRSLAARSVPHAGAL